MKTKKIRNSVSGCVARIKQKIETEKSKFMEQRYAHEIKELFISIPVQLLLTTTVQKFVSKYPELEHIPYDKVGAMFAIAIPISLAYLNNRAGIMGDKSKEVLANLESTARNLISSVNTLDLPDETKMPIYKKTKILFYEIVFDSLQAVKYYLQTKQTQLRETERLLQEMKNSVELTETLYGDWRQ